MTDRSALGSPNQRGSILRRNLLQLLGVVAAAAVVCCNRAHASPASNAFSYPPAVLVFESPSNGSAAVYGTNINLAFSLRSSREGRILTHEEIEALREDGVSVCLAKKGDPRPPPCALLSTDTTLSLHKPLPGMWHTIVATLHHEAATSAGDDSDEARAWAKAGDSVSTYAEIEGLSSTSSVSMCGESACLDSSEKRSAYFDNVYSRMEYWAETRSGPGSTVHNTNRIRLALEEVIRSHGLTSILDAPCGDATWMPLVRGIDQVRYLGADISPSIVEDNRRKFSKLQDHSGGSGDEAVGSANAGGLHENSFIQADLVERIPPSMDGKPYDLIFVRDVMLHLAPRHNVRMLQNIEASGARFLMASTNVDGNDNWKADTFRPAIGLLVNLSLPPYCLRPPIALYSDAMPERPGQRMGLWELDPARPLVGSNGLCGHLSPGPQELT
ncbi:unnamed protein product [Ectocarpus sp. 6 AP-2014]